MKKKNHINKFPDSPAHAVFTPLPLHRFNIKFDGRNIPIITDFPLEKSNAKQYAESLIEHIQKVEAELSNPKPALTWPARIWR